MDNRFSRGIGRKVPSNILNPMITDLEAHEGKRLQKVAGVPHSWTTTFGGSLRHPGWMSDCSDPICVS